VEISQRDRAEERTVTEKDEQAPERAPIVSQVQLAQPRPLALNRERLVSEDIFKEIDEQIVDEQREQAGDHLDQDVADKYMNLSPAEGPH